MKGKKHFNYSLSSHIKNQTIRIEAGADLGKKKLGGLNYAVSSISSYLRTFSLLFMVKKSKRMLRGYPWVFFGVGGLRSAL